MVFRKINGKSGKQRISRNKWSIDSFLIVFLGISVSKKKMVGIQHGIDMKKTT